MEIVPSCELETRIAAEIEQKKEGGEAKTEIVGAQYDQGNDSVERSESAEVTEDWPKQAQDSVYKQIFFEEVGIAGIERHRGLL